MFCMRVGSSCDAILGLVSDISIVFRLSVNQIRKRMDGQIQMRQRDDSLERMEVLVLTRSR